MSVASAVSEAEYFRWEGVVRPSDEPAGLAFRAGQGGDRYWAILESARLRIGRTLDGKEQVFGEHIAPQAKRLCLAVEVVPAQQDENGPAWYIGSALSPPAIEIRAKTWPDTEPEPDWQLSVTSDPFVPGQYGEAYWDIPSTSARYPFGGRLSVIGALHSVREVRFERLAFAPSEAPQHVAPCATIQLGPNGGSWLALGDLDNDGRLDFLSARNDNQSVTALVAVNPEGEVLWQRGGGGRPDIGYDVPCTIYDLNGDGKTEVLYSSEGDLIVLEGATGREIRRHALPDGLRAADCIVLTDLRGLGRRQDVVIKDRYAKVYAYTAEFEPLWRWEGNTGHHPEPADIDGDGKDELRCGFATLDDDGTVLWQNDLPGHADTTRIGLVDDAHETRILSACCGGNQMALFDVRGNMLWQMKPPHDYHFQTALIGDVRRDLPGREIVVDNGWARPGRAPLFIVSAQGEIIGTYYPDYQRFFALVDWDAGGEMQIAIPQSAGLFDGRGNKRVELLNVPPPNEGGKETPFVRAADLCGDGRDEIIIHNGERIVVYTDPRPAPRPIPPQPCEQARHYNFTFY